jgi:hypothetical protein
MDKLRKKIHKRQIRGHSHNTELQIFSVFRVLAVPLESPVLVHVIAVDIRHKERYDAEYRRICTLVYPGRNAQKVQYREIYASAGQPDHRKFE